jgi:hypothetical protein
MDIAALLETPLKVLDAGVRLCFGLILLLHCIPAKTAATVRVICAQYLSLVERMPG